MYRVLFEVSYIGNIYGLAHIVLGFGILLFLYFSIRGIARTEDKRVQGRELARVLEKVVLVIIVGYIISLIKGYMDIVVQYKSGHYVEIEGVTEDYVSNLGRGPVETFTLDGVYFECSDKATWGYCPPRKNGSVIRGNGRHLRIRYIPNRGENVIVYIERLIPEKSNSH